MRENEMSTYRIVLALKLDTDSEEHAEQCADTLFDGGDEGRFQLGSNWEALNPQVTVEDVEHTS